MSNYNIKYKVGDLVRTKDYPIVKIMMIRIEPYEVFYQCQGFNSRLDITEKNILGHVEVISLTKENEWTKVILT